MTEAVDLNTQVIQEFRSNGGRVGGPFAGVPMVLVHHVGAKSGTHRVNPMMYRKVGDAYAVFASAAGSDKNPDWYHNLLAHPDTEIEVGSDTVAVRARDLPREERDPIWERQKQDYPDFAGYEAQTSRVIPVVVLEPR